jgi:hypothetical protein
MTIYANWIIASLVKHPQDPPDLSEMIKLSKAKFLKIREPKFFTRLLPSLVILYVSILLHTIKGGSSKCEFGHSFHGLWLHMAASSILAIGCFHQTLANHGPRNHIFKIYDNCLYWSRSDNLCPRCTFTPTSNILFHHPPPPVCLCPQESATFLCFLLLKVNGVSPSEMAKTSCVSGMTVMTAGAEWNTVLGIWRLWAYCNGRPWSTQQCASRRGKGCGSLLSNHKLNSLWFCPRI